MTGYTPIYFVMAFIMALACAFMLYHSWRYVENKWVTARTLPVALLTGLILWFLSALVLVLVLASWRDFVIRWFGGNGFYFAAIFSMLAMLLHHQLLTWIARR